MKKASSRSAKKTSRSSRQADRPTKPTGRSTKQSSRSIRQSATGELPVDVFRLDGNSAAGMLSEVFVPDLTQAMAKCAGCNATQAMGTLFVYSHGMGAVMRCPHCDNVILRIARTPTRIWLDATGATSIVISTSR